MVVYIQIAFKHEFVKTAIRKLASAQFHPYLFWFNVTLSCLNSSTVYICSQSDDNHKWLQIVFWSFYGYSICAYLIHRHGNDYLHISMFQNVICIVFSSCTRCTRCVYVRKSTDSIIYKLMLMLSWCYAHEQYRSVIFSMLTIILIYQRAM